MASPFFYATARQNFFIDFLKNVQIEKIIRRNVQHFAKRDYLQIVQFKNPVFKAAVLLLGHQHFFSDLRLGVPCGTPCLF